MIGDDAIVRQLETAFLLRITSVEFWDYHKRLRFRVYGSEYLTALHTQPNLVVRRCRDAADLEDLIRDVLDAVEAAQRTSQ